MYSFRNDYSEGAHPSILKALTETNLQQTCGYGLDPFCAEAAELIRTKCAAPDADVHFVVGGTQANLLVISAFLRSFEAAIAADTGHINVHETGAIEATGHKVLTVTAPDGKLTPALIDGIVCAHSGEHMVHPRLVYLSDSTEVGTIYCKNELIALREYCKAHNLYIYLDGARLGSALTAEGNDLTLADLAAYTDAFSIGGTKNGMLFGEAIVLSCPAVKADFRSFMKQRGAVFAKGRLLGIQFRALLENDLYFDLARHANAMAKKLHDGIAARGYPFLPDSPTNQIFFVLPTVLVAQLEKSFAFEVNFPVGADALCVRLVTSWATEEAGVDEFLRALPAAK